MAIHPAGVQPPFPGASCVEKDKDGNTCGALESCQWHSSKSEETMGQPMCNACRSRLVNKTRVRKPDNRWNWRTK